MSETCCDSCLRELTRCFYVVKDQSFCSQCVKQHDKVIDAMRSPAPLPTEPAAGVRGRFFGFDEGRGGVDLSRVVRYDDKRGAPDHGRLWLHLDGSDDAYVGLTGPDADRAIAILRGSK